MREPIEEACAPLSKWIKENSKLLFRRIESLNRSLVFDKYIRWPFPQDNGIRLEDFTDKRGKTLSRKEVNLALIKQIRTALNRDQYNSLIERRKNLFPGNRTFPLKTVSRLIVNHGGESVLESNISIHPYYGFPVVPASAIKGATRHYCYEYCPDQPELITSIFGSDPGRKPFVKGEVIFMDAWPSNHTGLDSFEIDLINPHYKDYYEGNKYPVDSINPEPHLFLAVKEEVEFDFMIGHNCAGRSQNETCKWLFEQAESLIVAALSTIGIGAKTGSSYGYFQEEVEHE